MHRPRQISLKQQILPLLASLALAGCANPEQGSLPEPAEAAPASDEASITPIHVVQGNGRSSPLQDEIVTISGIVTGDFQSGDTDLQKDLGGFFVQEKLPDADPLTSEGIFVEEAGVTAVDVAAGDRVNVTGTVAEYFGETRLVASTITVVGNGSILPLPVSFPAAGTIDTGGELIADLEHLEGMLVETVQPLLVSDLYHLERFGEIGLAAGGRLYQFTNGSAPNITAYAEHRRQTAARSLILDDGSLQQNPASLAYLNVRSGDAVGGLSGNLRYGRGSGGAGPAGYRLEPGSAPQFLSVNARPGKPPDPGGRLKVASFNVLNFFTTLDNGQNICGPSGSFGCRGADSIAEFERQRAKLVHTLRLLDADIIGLLEIENNGGTALANLVDGLNAAAGVRTWSYIPTGIVGSDAITAALIFRTDKVRAVGAFATLTTADDARFIDWRNRPALAQTFASIAENARFTVVVNHLKSKGSPCDDLQDPDRQDGQGNCNGTRTKAVLALVDWLAGDPTSSADPDYLVIGDLNAYAAEDPVTALAHAGYTNLLARVSGRFAYSFSFAGEVGALDHAFASVTMAPQVAGAALWHINSDEPPVLDYNLDFGRNAGWFDAQSPFRAADHDPVIIGLNPVRGTPAIDRE